MVYKYDLSPGLDFGEEGSQNAFARLCDAKMKLAVINELYCADPEFVDQLLENKILVDLLRLLQHQKKKWEPTQANHCFRDTLTRALDSRVKYLNLLAEFLQELCEADRFKKAGMKATYLRNAYKDVVGVGKTISADSHFAATMACWKKAKNHS